MPFWAVKFSVSPETKPEIATLAELSVELPGSVTVSAGSSATAEPPPVKVELAPATSAIAVWIWTVVVAVPLETNPSVAVHEIVREAALALVVAKVTVWSADS